MDKMIHRFMLQHAHPMKFVAEILGVMWGIYFLWIHNWIGAVASSVVLFFGSTLALWNKPIDHLAATALGRIMLVYTTPLNFIIYNFSALPVIYGAWTHQLIYILIGYSALLSPHLWWWKR
jgi:hypothetical protein